MLIRMSPEQVSEGWEMVGGMIEKSLAPIGIANHVTMTNALTAVLSDQLVCWMIADETGPKGLVTTCVVQDPITNVDSLLIYSMYGYGVSRQLMLDGIQKLKEYAKGIGCQFLSAYTILPNVGEVVKATGGNANFTYVNWRL